MAVPYIIGDSMCHTEYRVPSGTGREILTLHGTALNPWERIAIYLADVTYFFGQSD